MSAQLKATIIAATAMNVDTMIELTDGVWHPDWVADFDVSQAELLVEAAGRACYQSWCKPNPDRQDNESYLKHILEVEHFSVLRHATITMYIQGVSRNLTHELVRHHVGMDFSQLSQRYVDASAMDYVVPPAIRGDDFLEQHLEESWGWALAKYEIAVKRLDPEGKNRKKAREAARAFLPGCAETKIVVTANLQAWRNFIQQRATPSADSEIRELAVEVARQLKEQCRNAFQDLTIDTLPDGMTVAVF